jgi:TetR/AcrR family transcriptional regulator
MLLKARSKPKSNRSQRRTRGRPDDLGGKSVGAEAIVLKVCELLRELAPREVTLLRVAEYAGVDRSLIRYYFRNRASLLLAAARHLFAQLQNEMAAAKQGLQEDDPASEIRENARALLRFQVKHPYFHRLMIDEVVNSEEPEAQAFFKSFISAAIAKQRAAAGAAARHAGMKSVDGAFLYTAIIGMCELFATSAPILKVAFGKDYDPEAVNRQYEKFLCDYVIDGLRKR